jgi:hypothetical protein
LNLYFFVLFELGISLALIIALECLILKGGSYEFLNLVIYN